MDNCLTNVDDDMITFTYSKDYLKYEKQTPEICLRIMKQNGLALQYVKEQLPEN